MDRPNLMLTPNAVYLISRLLASTPDVQGQVRRNGYRLLRKARRVTHNWMREIVLKLQDAIDDDQTSELQRRACDMAATCRATFDVEDGTHLDVLQQMLPLQSNVPSSFTIILRLTSATHFRTFRNCSIEITDSLISWKCRSLNSFETTNADWIPLSHQFGPHTVREIEAGDNWMVPIHDG